MNDLSIPELIDWLTARQKNAERIATWKSGDDKAGWLEDAAYFKSAVFALSQRPAAHVWLPIATRPKDYRGTHLVTNDRGEVAPHIRGVIHNNPGTANDWQYGEAVTHWMPLPLPPAPGCAAPTEGVQGEGWSAVHVAVDLLREVVGPLEVSAAILEDEDGGAAIEELLVNVKRYVEQFDRIRALKGDKKMTTVQTCCGDGCTGCEQCTDITPATTTDTGPIATGAAAGADESIAPNRCESCSTSLAPCRRPLTGCLHRPTPSLQEAPKGDTELLDALIGLRNAVDAAGYSTEFQRNLARADAAIASQGAKT